MSYEESAGGASWSSSFITESRKPSWIVGQGPMPTVYSSGRKVDSRYRGLSEISQYADSRPGRF